VIRAIAEAREHGDLSKNAEYHAASERQSFIEGRLAELEDKISRAEVIDVSKLSGRQVKFGATVTLVDEDTDEKAAYQIVGQDESDIKTKLISITSPLARAPIGQQISETMQVSAPGGSVLQGSSRSSSNNESGRRATSLLKRLSGKDAAHERRGRTQPSVSAGLVRLRGIQGSGSCGNLPG
jgi:transcription elongation factor GreA